MNKYVEAHEKQLNENMKMTDACNHILGRYIAYAFNKPKAYPKKPFLSESDRSGERMSISQMQDIAKRQTKLLGGVIQ